MSQLSETSLRKVELRTEVPGPCSREMRRAEDELLAPGSQNYALLAGIVVEHAEGSTITDIDGNRLLDIIGGIAVGGIGHSHPEWVRSVCRQAAGMAVGSYTSLARIEMLERLSRHAPAADIRRAQIYSSGADAVESALRLAKSHTGAHQFVSFDGGFHGKTMGALSLMGSNFKDGFGPFVPGSHTVPYANCYRCPLKLSYPSCGLACVEEARHQLKTGAVGEFAAFIVEPMQGTAGNIIPPPDWLPAIASLAKEFDALLIADEMITGFGRTGTYWGIEHSGVEPDIVTLGKQFGGGFPISAVMARQSIVNAKPWADPSGSSSSYGGNSLAAAAAAATLRIIDEEQLVENSRRVGEYFLEALKPLADRYPFVGNVGGCGLMIGIQLVKDKGTREPLPQTATRQLFDECLRRGLLTMAYAANFRIQPAMTIDETTVDEVVAILTEAFDAVAANVLR
jgi:4-aminobutyrate aminotransferase / (S)-3-amino-2-methylpropionate transaminase / 5-aminovalerate transaminase